MNKEFSYRANGWFCMVGGAVKVFQLSDHKTEQSCFDAACSWFNSEVKFQDPDLSFNQAYRAVRALKALVRLIRSDFPIEGKDFKWVLCPYTRQICLVFGSLVVFECGDGYNIEIVTNWLTKERFDVCSGVSIETAAEVVHNSSASRSYWHKAPTELHLSEKNRAFIESLCILG